MTGCKKSTLLALKITPLFLISWKRGTFLSFPTWQFSTQNVLFSLFRRVTWWVKSVTFAGRSRIRFLIIVFGRDAKSMEWNLAQDLGWKNMSCPLMEENSHSLALSVDADRDSAHRYVDTLNSYFMLLLRVTDIYMCKGLTFREGLKVRKVGFRKGKANSLNKIVE